MEGRLQFKHVDKFYGSFEEIREAIEASIDRAERVGGMDEIIPLYGEPVVFRYREGNDIHLVLGVGDMNAVGGREPEVENIVPKYTLLDFDALNEGGENLDAVSGAVENVIEGLGFDPEDGHFDDDAEPYHMKRLEYFEGQDSTILNYIYILHNKIKESVTGLENLSIDYNSTAQEIELKDADGNVISHFDASMFIKDGMLKEAHFVATYEQAEEWDPDDHHTAELPYLLLIWNTDAGKPDYTRIPMSSFYDIYVGESGITVDGYKIRLKLDNETESFLTVSANGLKLAGVQDAILSARTEAVSSAKTYTDEQVAAASDSINDAISGLQRDITFNTEAISDLQDFSEKVGTIDGYVLSTVVSGNTADIASLEGRMDDAEDAIENLEEGKVDKVEGKGLSTNDFTNELKLAIEGAALRLGENEKMLSLTGGILSSSFSVEYDSEAGKIFFYGKPDYKIGELDASQFIVDGLLENVEVVTEGGVKYLRFTFRVEGGTETVDVEVDDLMEDIDEKIGEGFVDESGATISITHKINELEQEFDDYINSDNMKFASDFKVAGIVGTLGTGKWKNGDTIPAGTAVIDVLKDILQQRLLPEGVLPTATISLENGGAYEVGSVVAPAYKINFNAGRYEYSDGTTGGTNITPSEIYVSTINNNTFGSDSANTLVGTLSSITIADDTHLSVYANIEYTNNGYVPKDNLGNEVPEKQIQDGYVVDKEGRRNIQSPEKITSYRPMFYGSLSDAVFSGKTDQEVADLLTKSNKETVDRVPIDNDAEVVVIMLPVLSEKSIKKIIDTDSGFDMKDVFVRHQATIKTYASEASAVTSYYVYVFDPHTQIGENVYKIIYE